MFEYSVCNICTLYIYQKGAYEMDLDRCDSVRDQSNHVSLAVTTMKISYVSISAHLLTSIRMHKRQLPQGTRITSPNASYPT